MLRWLRHSGISVIITLNPLHWYLKLWARREHPEWEGPNEKTWAVSFLFFTIRIWIDDGSW
jgi:hypothetical protein